VRKITIIEEDKLFKAQDYMKHTLLSAKNIYDLEVKLKKHGFEKLDGSWYIAKKYEQALKRIKQRHTLFHK